MPAPRWEKAISRTEDVLHWDACLSVRRERVRTGEVYWGSESDLMIRNGPRLAIQYGDASRENPYFTNFNEYVEEKNPRLDKALDEGIRIIDTDLAAVPGTTREDARALYERFRIDMGLMSFGLFTTAVPQSRLVASIGRDAWERIERKVLLPYRAPMLVREHEAIARVQQQQAGHPEEWVREQVERLAEEFGFIHSEYVSKSWVAKDYLDAISGAYIASEEPAHLDTASFDEYQKWLVMVIQKLVYMLDEGKSALVRTNWALRETLSNLGLDDRMLQLTEKEFRTWTETGAMPDAKALEDRKLYYGLLSLDERYEHYFGKEEVERLMREQGIVTETDFSDVSEIKGQVASRGKVTGRVRLIETQEDSNALVDGEILVASMTTPAYISAMRRAGAYVTDEGGTICHAAIVAREFKKPCIVGTKIATKALKTGDMVEVDATSGTVRIIERA